MDKDFYDVRINLIQSKTDPLHSTDEPGEGLPPDFDRDLDWSDDQLIYLDEYYAGRLQQMKRAMGYLLNTHPESQELNMRHVVINIVIMLSLLGMTISHAKSIRMIAKFIGVSKSGIYRHRKAIKDKIASLARGELI